jgi:SRSO17 transposase
MKEADEEFGTYLNHLARAFGHVHRHAALKGYCSGVVLPLSRKSIKPMSAHIF